MFDAIRKVVRVMQGTCLSAVGALHNVYCSHGPNPAVQGNQYTTTMQIINSAIGKLSKLTVTQKVYRGISGGLLPPEFWQPNEFSVKVSNLLSSQP